MQNSLDFFIIFHNRLYPYIGRLPYGAQQNFQELLKFIKGGGRLEKPPKTTDEL